MDNFPKSVSVRLTRPLVALTERQARREGLSRDAVVLRAIERDLQEAYDGTVGSPESPDRPGADPRGRRS
jgi:hypothetical protein